ncbi:MAG: RsmB/NOP family class I SAM-dependent RNA methyltransferase [Succinivibrio sp.]
MDSKSQGGSAPSPWGSAPEAGGAGGARDFNGRARRRASGEGGGFSTDGGSAQRPGGRDQGRGSWRSRGRAPSRAFRLEGGRSFSDRRQRRPGLSPFQERLVMSILRDVLCQGKLLDRAYAIWFAKVKIDPVEQGFIIRNVNAMFQRLSMFAYAAGLKRPSDFENHPGRLLFTYCEYMHWPAGELSGEENFDRSGVEKRLGEAQNDPLLSQGCPLWLDEICRKELGDRWEDERRALSLPPRRFIRANTLKCDRDSLASRLSDEGVVTRPVAGCRNALEVTSNSALFRTAAFRDGLFEQQDAGSQQIAEFLDPKEGERVVDACAGAGGKTLQIAALMKGRGTIIAMDTEDWKLEDLKRRARRAGAFNIEPRLIESSKTAKRLYGQADRVLIDAPCSGTGIIRRIPDTKWRDGAEKIRSIRYAQEEILERYAMMARVGGTVVYSTCSILPSEDEDQVRKFLKKHEGEFELVEERRLMPSGGTDGFYMAKLERIADHKAAGREGAAPGDGGSKAAADAPGAPAGGGSASCNKEAGGAPDGAIKTAASPAGHLEEAKAPGVEDPKSAEPDAKPDEGASQSADAKENGDQASGI